MPSRTRRGIVAAAIGIIAGIVAAAQMSPEPPALQAFDFTYPWMAARALLSGANPYAAVRNAPMPFGSEFSYPLPAAMIAVPLAWLPVRVAGSCFVAFGVAILAFALARNGFNRLILLASAPLYQAIRSVQWSPLITGAALLPCGLWLGVVKPNLFLGLAAFRWKDHRALLVGVIGAALLCLVSIAAMPSWPTEWVRALRSTGASPLQYRLPIASPLGAPLVLVLLRWRTAEAWMILTMACVPQSGFFYDQLPLLLVARSRRETLFASACSVMAFALAFPLRAIPDLAVRSSEIMPYVIAGVYWPAVLIVLVRHESAIRIARICRNNPTMN